GGFAGGRSLLVLLLGAPPFRRLRHLRLTGAPGRGRIVINFPTTRGVTMDPATQDTPRHATSWLSHIGRVLDLIFAGCVCVIVAAIAGAVAGYFAGSALTRWYDDVTDGVRGGTVEVAAAVLLDRLHKCLPDLGGQPLAPAVAVLACGGAA